MTHTAQLVHVTPDAEHLVAYMARVSNPNNQNNTETAPNLIRYLIKHKHWSPFEMVSLCVEINTTRSISAQILRHRSFSFQEFSQRYAEAPGAPVIPHFRTQDTRNRQASHDTLDSSLQAAFQGRALNLFSESFQLYKDMVDAGVAKETARDVLPLSTPTRLYMHGTIRSWIHYLDLRAEEGTQLEHQKIAKAIKAIFAEELPDIYNAVWPKYVM